MGGFILTNLGNDIFSKSESDTVNDYLTKIVPPSKKYEYILGQAGDDSAPIEAGLYIYAPDTNDGKEYPHYLFEKDERVYDLWLDNLLVDAETMCKVLIISGVDPFAEWLKQTRYDQNETVINREQRTWHGLMAVVGALLNLDNM